MYLIVYLVLMLVPTIMGARSQLDNHNGHQSTLLRGLNVFFWDYVQSSNHHHLDSINISSRCKDTLDYFNQAFKEDQQWALIMMDSSSRFPVDSLGSGYADYGNFDQCISINEKSIVGQHCTISLLPTLNVSQWSRNPFTRNKVISREFDIVLQLTLCIPSKCSNIDLQNILSNALDSIDWKLLKIDQCKVKTSFSEAIYNSNLSQMIALLLLVSIVAVNVISTWYQWYYYTGINNKSLHWSRHFSLINSYNSLIVTNLPYRNTFLTQLSISVHTYTIGIHSLMWFATGRGWGLRGNQPLFLYRHEWWIKGSPDFISEILFYYGGLTHSLALWKAVGTTTPLVSSFKHMIIKMFMIISTMIPVTCLMIIMPLIVTGPLDYNLSESVSESCSKNIIPNHFFWQNHIRPQSDKCLGHTWSVAVEYQLIPLIIVLIHLYKRTPEIAITLNIATIITSLVYIAINVYRNNIQPHCFSRSIDTSSIYVYQDWGSSPFFHAWIYLSSPLWVYKIMTGTQKSIKLSRKFGLIVASLYILPSIWVALSDYDGPVLNSIYSIIYRLFVWSFYTCIVMANSDELRSFFSHPMDKIRSKSVSSPAVESTLKHRALHFVSTLFRSTYYIHVVVILLYYNNQRTAISSQRIYIYSCLELIILSLFGGFIFHLFVMYPVTSLLSSTQKSIKNH